SCRNARRHRLAQADRAFLPEERASLDPAGGRRRMPRDRACEFPAAGGKMAHVMAGVFSGEVARGLINPDVRLSLNSGAQANIARSLRRAMSRCEQWQQPNTIRGRDALPRALAGRS